MGRPRKRARSAENDHQDNPVPASTNINAIPGPAIPSEQVSSPGLSFFDFLGMGDASVFDSSFVQQLQQQPQQDQSVDKTSGVFTSGLGALPLSAIPELPPPAASSRQPPTVSATHRYDTLFPRSLFGMNFGELDFNTGPANGTAAGLPTPPGQNSTDNNSNNNNSNNSNNNTGSPSGVSDVPSLSHGSQSAQSTSPAPPPTQPMIPGELSPGTSGTSTEPLGWQMSQPAVGTLPPSFETTQQQDPAASQEANMPDVNGPSPSSSKTSLPPLLKGQPTLLGGIPTISHVDAYNKASSAWLLTAPNRVCGCLARLYLALDSLQHLPTEVGPAMCVARNAAHTAHDTILCPTCSPPEITLLDGRPPVQAFQNLMILSALLPSIAHAYQRIVTMVDEETARATAANVRLRICLTAYGGVWGHMARWDNACAGTSSMDNSVVDPPLWRLVVRALLKMDVYGIHLDREDIEDENSIGGVNQAAMSAIKSSMYSSTGGPQNGNTGKGSNGAARLEGKATGPPKPGFFMVPVHYGLKDVAELMEERARSRHAFMDAAYDAGLLKTSETGGNWCYKKLPPGEKHNCQKVIEIARQEIERLVIV